ncbi:MAG: hypothetical protein LBJ12_09095 [Oscillospiraceae bacterium]|nr:hypothetical protein [Oscillospiraceae bacterium]
MHRVVRTLILPGFDDLEEAQTHVLDFIAAFPNVSFEALPYHKFGVAKYDAPVRKYLLG